MNDGRHRVVVGGGFGGLASARGLADQDVGIAAPIRRRRTLRR